MDLEYADVLVLVPLDEELAALLEAFGKAGWEVKEEPESSTDFVVHLAIRGGQTGTNRVQSCRIVKLPDQNVLNAASATAKCFETLDTSIVMSFGIAGKIHEQDVSLGDVVIASNILYYDPVKEKDKDEQSRLVPLQATCPEPSVIRKLKGPDYKVVAGLIASGSRLMADPDSETRGRLRKINDKILCVEMEAAGVGNVRDQIRPCHKYYAIKGLSDRADGSKGDGDDSMWREIAAANAAKTLVKLLLHLSIHSHERYILSEKVKDKHFKAFEDLKRMRDSITAVGLTTDLVALYHCLYGLSSPIPMHFHWEQEGQHLHWVDFKLILMLNSLPDDLVELVPNVTFASPNIGDEWAKAVEGLVGSKPVPVDTGRQRHGTFASELLRELSFANTASQFAAVEQKEVDWYIQEEILTNMAATSNQNRLIVCSWRQSLKRWMALIPLVGYRYAAVSWPDMKLGDKLGKSESPGSELFMDAPYFDGLKAWCANNPALVPELAAHFSFLSELLLTDPTTSCLIDVLRATVIREG